MPQNEILSIQRPAKAFLQAPDAQASFMIANARGAPNGLRGAINLRALINLLLDSAAGVNDL
jgi:hypothetical protein